MNLIIKKILLLAAFSTNLILPACGGGSSGGGAAGGTYPAVTSHYYTDSATPSVGPLWVVKSDTPSVPVVVDANALIGNTPYGQRVATVKVGSKTIGTDYDYAVVYVAGGKLYKQLAGATTPVQISNITGIGSGDGTGVASSSLNDLCGVKVYPDHANPDNSIVTVISAGLDSTCNNSNDTRKWVRLSADSTTVPNTLPGQILLAVLDANTFAISGFIGTPGFGTTAVNLVKYNANLAAAVNIGTTTFIPGNVFFSDAVWSTTALLQTINSPITEYRMVDTASNTMSTPLHTFAAGSYPTASIFDESNFYFVDSASNTVIRKFLVSGANAAVPFLTLANRVVSLALTSNSVIYQTRNNSSNNTYDSTIYSATKSGGLPVVLAVGIIQGVTTGDVVSIPAANSAGYVFYNRTGYTDYSKGFVDARLNRAEAIKEDGTGKLVYGTNTNPSDWANPFYSNNTFASLMLLEYATNATSWGNAKISIVDASSATKTSYTQKTLLPFGISFFGLGISGPRGLVYANLPSQSDIFFVDSTAMNSFTRVTNSTNIKYVIY